MRLCQGLGDLRYLFKHLCPKNLLHQVSRRKSSTTKAKRIDAAEHQSCSVHGKEKHEGNPGNLASRHVRTLLSLPLLTKSPINFKTTKHLIWLLQMNYTLHRTSEQYQQRYHEADGLAQFSPAPVRAARVPQDTTYPYMRLRWSYPPKAWCSSASFVSKTKNDYSRDKHIAFGKLARVM